ncbi:MULTISPECIES: hypothetical protein [Bacillus cereus group]|uniref:Uncharacterized protein n=1 Tax=Bacillus thuringiensis TaxID=1428 RepID=A0A9X6Z5Q4_BACTU|nr:MULTISPECIES: hypothetical protein [Bacillus cereus group]MEC3272613.1 hypothetical protein [Bacillus thuringiensis]MED0951036.1 hypothetical protein [Bacillus mobilis]PFB09107.1 hypothetical protein CN398_05590 [Bacillus thuringiensis]HDR7922192.1 hypothetical protein [Bacillus paranthracis]
MEMKHLVEIKRNNYLLFHPGEDTEVIPFVSKDDEQEVLDALLKDSYLFNGYIVKASLIYGSEYAVVDTEKNTTLGELQITPIFEHLGRYFKLEEIEI